MLDDAGHASLLVRHENILLLFPTVQAAVSWGFSRSSKNRKRDDRAEQQTSEIVVSLQKRVLAPERTMLAASAVACNTSKQFMRPEQSRLKSLTAKALH